LPDLRGRVPISQSPNFVRGTRGGSELVTLDQSTLAAHTHAMGVSSAAATQANTVAAVYATSPSTTPIYGAPTNLVAIAQSNPQLKPAGAGQSHENRQPYLVLTYIICTSGFFPSRP
jgi:microcystin-dependent protein